MAVARPVSALAKLPAAGSDAASTAALVAILKIEEAARKAAGEGELLTLAVNDIMRLAKARQAFAVKPWGRGFKVAAVSSLGSFDPNAPLVQGIERLVAGAAGAQSLLHSCVLSAEPTNGSQEASLKTYPFQHLLWLPFLARGGMLLGGLVLARDVPWSDAERAVPERVAQSFAHAWQALVPARVWRPDWLSRARIAGLVAVISAALLLLPVPMTALAPFEVGSSQSFVVAAPMDGVIDEIVVEANAQVNKGDVLLRLNDITLRNRLEISGHEVAVAQARMTQSMQLAFGDARGRHDIGISRAEYALKVAERDYARELLEKSQVRAMRDGIAVYADRRRLTGKPVVTGERIMEISDPRTVELRIDVPVGDAISVRSPSQLTAFFDTDPLHARTGTVRHADYQARRQTQDVLAFRVLADLDKAAGAPPRLGSRGTAQLTGERVPLAYYLFRRPLTALRQRFGS